MASRFKVFDPDVRGTARYRSHSSSMISHQRLKPAHVPHFLMPEPRLFNNSAASERLRTAGESPERTTAPERPTAGVDAVQHPAVAGQKGAGILDADRALERRLGQIAHLRRHVDHAPPAPASTRYLQGKKSLAESRICRTGGRGPASAGGQQAAGNRAQSAFPGLVGAQTWAPACAGPRLRPT